ncbi:ribosomal protein S18 acetylase RimI-like enzyme [Oxalobacteraceae bacterium GrIS 2.11]
MPVIRRAEQQDAGQLARLQEQTFRATFEATNTPEDMALHCSTHYSTALQEQEILNPEIITLVCAAQANLIGFAQLRWGSWTTETQTKRCLEIQRLYVDEAWHGRGIAQQIMQECLAFSVAQGAEQVWLGVWENNPRAIRFYQKFDFVEAGEHIFMVGTDAQRDIIFVKCPI